MSDLNASMDAMNHKKLRWGILGTGEMAGKFCLALAKSEFNRISAVSGFCEAMQESVKESECTQTGLMFCEHHKIPQYHNDFQALLSDTNIDAVYIALPHSAHTEWAIKTAFARKHILCEKPLGMSSAEAAYAIAQARDCGVRLLCGYKYSRTGWFTKLLQLVESGVIGDLLTISVFRGTNVAENPNGRHYNKQLGGGSILDMGVYAAHFAGKIIGAASGKTFVKPVEVNGVANMSATGVDRCTIATLMFPNGTIASLTCGLNLHSSSMASTKGGYAEIIGTKGALKVDNLGNIWPYQYDDHNRIFLAVGDKDYEMVELDSERDSVDDFLGCLSDPEFQMEETWGEYIDTEHILDCWRHAIGLVYDTEISFPHRGSAGKTFYAGAKSLSYHRNRESNGGIIPTVKLPGISTPISRIVMGLGGGPVRDLRSYDWYTQLGGNCYITSHHYDENSGQQQALAHWIKTRELRRKDIVLMVMGGHPPLCDPERISEQLLQSLECLGTDYIDLYMLHADNTSVPVDEFIDALNFHLGNDSIRALGASNWSVERYEEANRWAEKNGKVGFAALSNYFGLAKMEEVPWPHAVSMTNLRATTWLAKTQTPLFPYSSQSKGFFKSNLQTNEFDSILRNEINYGRRERARKLATKLGVDPTCIALAYVLAQPFPTFPMIGPRHSFQLSKSLDALKIELSREDCRWLDG